MLLVLGVRAADHVSRRVPNVGHRGDHTDSDRVTRVPARRDQDALPTLLRPGHWRRGRRHGGVLAAGRAGAGGGDDDYRRGEAPLAPVEQLLRRAACLWGRTEPVGQRAAAVSGRAIVSDAGGWSLVVSDARRLPVTAGADVPATAGADVPATAGPNILAGTRAAAAEHVWRRLLCDAALSVGTRRAALPNAIPDACPSAAVILGFNPIAF